MKEIICRCSCYEIGSNVLHFFPCCNLCYAKYIEANGDINMELYEAAVKKLKAIEDKQS